MLHEFDRDRPINPASSIWLGTIKTIVSVEKNELSTLSLFRERVSSKFRIGIELVDGRVICLATSSSKGRVDWLEHLTMALVEQAKCGHHEDPTIVDHIKAMCGGASPPSSTTGLEAPASPASDMHGHGDIDLLGLDAF